MPSAREPHPHLTQSLKLVPMSFTPHSQQHYELKYNQLQKALIFLNLKISRDF